MGNRIKEVEGTSVKQYLVAPSMGGGFESTDLITDASGSDRDRLSLQLL